MIGLASAQDAGKPVMSLLVDETEAARKLHSSTRKFAYTLARSHWRDYQLLLAWNTVLLYPRGIDQNQADDSALRFAPFQLETGQFAGSYC
jgi:hypothetical protein